jgi:hypothetical protein
MFLLEPQKCFIKHWEKWMPFKAKRPITTSIELQDPISFESSKRL